MDYCYRYENCKVGFTLREFDAAFSAIKDRSRIDGQGVAVASLYCIYLAAPDRVMGIIEGMLASTGKMETCHISGRIVGKQSSHPETSATRCILPQSAALQIMDALLAARLQTFISEQWPQGPLIYEGAQPGTQCADVVSALRIVDEKFLDSLSEGAILTLDIGRFYDSLSALAVLRRLSTLGITGALAAMVLRFQMLVGVKLKCMNQ